MTGTGKWTIVPLGKGRGMVLKVQPIYSAVKKIQSLLNRKRAMKKRKSRAIFFYPWKKA